MSENIVKGETADRETSSMDGESSEDVRIEITPPEGEEERGPTRKLVVIPIKEKRVSYAGIPPLDNISEDGSTTSARHDRSRKTSMFSSQLTQQQQRKLSCDPFLLVNQRKYSDILAPTRKFSGVGITQPIVIPSRKVSIEPLNLPGVAKKYSVISIGSDFDDQETFETLPHADHYRRDLYEVVGELRQRPTLDELRDDERVGRTSFFSKLHSSCRFSIIVRSIYIIYYKAILGQNGLNIHFGCQMSQLKPKKKKLDLKGM